MPDEILTADDVSPAVLKEIFDAAYMETSMDPDGDVTIKEEWYSCYLRPDPDGKLVGVYAIFGTQPWMSQQARMEFANRVNDQVKLIRASIMDDGRCYFDYYIPVDGGITRKAVVLAVRRFLSCLEEAMHLDTGNIIPED